MSLRERQMQKILIVDDNPVNIDVLVDLLDEYELHVSLNGANALALLQEQEIDLILLDVMMPEMDGFDVAAHLKNDPALKDIPILFLTAKEDDESIEKAFALGAADYLVKPFRPRELRARVATHLKLAEQFKALHYAANFDYLSGARNRRSFFEAITRYVTDDFLGRLFAVMIDIDRFKGINDRYGHASGDRVIKALSAVVQEQMDDEALFARMGGEEFAVILLGDCDDALAWSEALRRKIEQCEIDNGAIRFSISCGISCWSERGMSVDQLLDTADKALYEAKESGRNRVIFRI